MVGGGEGQVCRQGGGGGGQVCRQGGEGGVRSVDRVVVLSGL